MRQASNDSIAAQVPVFESDAKTLGPDDIQLALPVARSGSRLLAAGIDYALLLGLQIAISIAGVFAMALIDSDELIGWLFVAIVVVGFLLQWGYFIAFELYMRGCTPGKRAAGLRVVDRTGGAPGAVALVVRNLLRPVDILVGLPLMAMDRHARRLGDRFGGTLVIHESGGDVGPNLGRIPAAWGPREVAVAEAFFARLDTMDPGQRLYLGRRLLGLLERDAPELLAEAGIRRDTDDPVAAVGQLLQVS